MSRTSPSIEPALETISTPLPPRTAASRPAIEPLLMSRSVCQSSVDITTP
jgi:hypothetical protein